MPTIEEYIEQSKTMPNTSDGGSAAYHFDDVVLVKYTNLLKYADRAREDAENIMAKANALNAKGIRTPKHLAIKRTIEGDSCVCYVLQERAPGKCFKYYTYPEDKNEKLKLQTIIALAPDSHFEKLVRDIAALLHLGIELKPKNIFYSEDVKNGGFTIIDLLREHGKPFNANDIGDVVRLYNCLRSVFVQLGISSYDDSFSNSQKQMSKIIDNQIQARIFQAMEKVLPNFRQHRRWLLRILTKEEQTAIKAFDVAVGDLTLTKNEEKTFDDRINQIVKHCIESIESGESKYWQVCHNLISGGLQAGALYAAWMYHRKNELLTKRAEFESDYDFKFECERELRELAQDLIDKKLAELAKTSTNANVLEAAADMEKEQAIRIKNKK